MKWWPIRSLRGQTLLIMLVGLLVSHSVAILLYSDDRGEALTSVEAEDMAERIAGMVRLISKLPDDLHEAVARASSTSSFLVSVDRVTGPAEEEELGHAAIEHTVGPYLRDLVARVAPDWRVIHVGNVAGVPGDRPDAMQGVMADDPKLAATSLYSVLSATVQNADDQQIHFVTRLPDRKTPWPGPVGYSILIVTCVVLALSAWSVRRITRPLEAFAQAAEDLGKNIEKTPLREEGPSELIKAARALNAMQDRLKRLIENRTQMLAAVSHDLRTPVTLLRLRAEFLKDEPERAKFLATLDDMDLMIQSFLEFARRGSELEASCRVDVATLIDSLCYDLAGAGFPVEAQLPDKSLLTCRRRELRRALTNIIDNAVKYGGGARVSLRDRPQAIEIEVVDNGPGIPPDRLATICMPFVRGEPSRNPASGGIGLGLSIARSIIEGHGGELDLRNRPEGGLLARIVLPK